MSKNIASGYLNQGKPATPPPPPQPAAALSAADDVLATLRAANSALRIQRDSALRQAMRSETNNKALLAHQAEIRAWLTDAIARWEATDDHAQTAYEIHQHAVELLRQAESYL